MQPSTGQMPFPGFEPYHGCGNPIAVPSGWIFLPDPLHFPRPKFQQGNSGPRCASAVLPFLLYFTVNPEPFVKPQQFCTDPRYCVEGGASPIPGMSRRVFFPEFFLSRSFFFPVNRCSCVTALKM